MYSNYTLTDINTFIKNGITNTRLVTNNLLHSLITPKYTQNEINPLINKINDYIQKTTIGFQNTFINQTKLIKFLEKWGEEINTGLGQGHINNKLSELNNFKTMNHIDELTNFAKEFGWDYKVQNF